jgi:hypothetical protein
MSVEYCDICDELDCGMHSKCETCAEYFHSCAYCDGEYCDCSESEWAVAANGITYCSQECADRAAEENEGD